LRARPSTASVFSAPGSLTAVFLALGLLAQATAAAARPSPTGTVDAKTATTSARLLLPFYRVDTTSLDGATTLFAVRNELDVPVELEIRYFRTSGPQAPQLPPEQVTLAEKAVKTVNVRTVDDLEVDADGVARGYVIIEALTEGAVIHGDFFQVTPGEDFATGARLLNVAPQSPHNDLCQQFSMRFLNGGGFDGGTRFVVWLESDTAPDPDEPIFDLAAYDQPGNLLNVRSFFAEEVAFEVSAAELLAPVSEDFGAIELQFSGGRVGHVSAVMSADDRYSVGLEAACLDP